jgi:hypothetical protein
MGDARASQYRLSERDGRGALFHEDYAGGDVHPCSCPTLIEKNVLAVILTLFSVSGFKCRMAQ